MAMNLRHDGMDRTERKAGILTLCVAVLAGLYFVCLYLLAGH